MLLKVCKVADAMIGKTCLPDIPYPLELSPGCE